MAANYSAVLDLSRALVVVLGAGKVAAQKLKGLPEGVSKVRVVAPKADPEVLAWLKRHPSAEHLARAFEPGDLRGCRLLFCCTPDADLNLFAARQAKALGAWVCQAAEPEQGDLRVPAVVNAGGLQLTLSTGGASPALAKALRQHFGKRLKASDLAFVLAELKALRPALKRDPAAKAALLKRITTEKAVAEMLEPRNKARHARLAALIAPKSKGKKR